jgi:LDH2 family malate/lactate/ureidoglycolate dehydrogenase
MKYRARRAREGIEIDRRIHDALIALAEGKRGAFTGPAEER